MDTQFAQEPYPRAHILKVMVLDALTALIGLAVLAWPFVAMARRPSDHYFPGDIDTTAHVALGALIVTAAAFRVLVAYGSLWLEVVLLALGAVTAFLPAMQHLMWAPRYHLAHVAAGLLIMGLAVISGACTWSVLRKRART